MTMWPRITHSCGIKTKMWFMMMQFLLHLALMRPLAMKLDGLLLRSGLCLADILLNSKVVLG
jgi:hypothetical protein